MPNEAYIAISSSGEICTVIPASILVTSFHLPFQVDSLPFEGQGVKSRNFDPISASQCWYESNKSLESGGAGII